ncbi:ABC transporter permease [Streptomyces sp. NBC_00006]|uniref:ABC transporter permease n=1 Tax=unclassified Streptomyces TaxID=2593676 RepID=UPI0022577B2B|nr:MULTISPECIES: ABC transporter permease [unclassified Streptomyces]MCX4828382.1 ABC transporter permease [Streptomyces sp. NBC_01016]MCX5532266.1 ABC transporter permease [Streptomyces sp. NBC_00006]
MSAATIPLGLPRTVLRLHRIAAWLWIAFVVVTGALLLWLWGPATAGLDITGHCDPAVANGCTAKGATADSYHYVLTFTDMLITLVPVAASVFAGGLLIGRELSRGTAQLAWTQSVSPARWLATKLYVPATSLILGTTVLVLLRRLVASAAPGLADNRWHDATAVYDALGPTAVAMPLLGLAIGAAVAFLARRTLPAATYSLIATAAVVGVLDAIRDRLWPSVTVTGDLREGYPYFAGSMTTEGALTGSGARVADPMCVDDRGCLASHNITGFYREGHPPSHFWPLQLVETGLILTLTAAATATAFYLLRRRAR